MGSNLGDIMIVTKQWFVIYDANGIIHLYGDNTGQRTETSLNLKEFDTKAKMLKYIQDNNLELQNETID